MVSVVILTSGEAKRLIKQLRKQTYQDFEIIVANARGIVNAMNYALGEAKGDIFVRVDDDISVRPRWLEKLVKSFDDPDVAGATGPTFVPKEMRENRDSIRMAEKPGKFLKWLFDDRDFAPAAIYKCGGVSYDSNFKEKFYKTKETIFEPDHLEGTNWAMRTHLIRQVGGFDPAFGGVAEWFDTDVEFKIKRLGYKFIYRRNAYVTHNLAKGEHYGERFEKGFSRISNWVRFHARHSEFHPKMIIWFFMLVGYVICPKFLSLFRR